MRDSQEPLGRAALKNEIFCRVGERDCSPLDICDIERVFMIVLQRLLARLLCLILGVSLMCGGAAPAWSDELVEVVTTTSDLKSLVEMVGGDRVHVTSIAPPAQDPHTFEPRLTNLQQLKQAQLVVKIGLDHDLWIDQLLREIDNPNLQRNRPGYVDASIGIPLLEARATTLAPTTGHTHGAGNPHYWLDPLNAATISGAIMEGLDRIDPDHATVYETNRANFLVQLQEKLKAWEEQLAPFQGKPILAYHNSWPYLARRFRLNVVDYIEPRPGVPASPAHLSQLIRTIKTQQVPLIIKEPYESERIPNLLSNKTGAIVVELVSSVGAVATAQDYFSLFDYNINALAQAFQASS